MSMTETTRSMTGAVPPPKGRLVTLGGLWQAIAGWRPFYVLAVACNVLSLLAQTLAILAGAWAVSLAIRGERPEALVLPVIVTLLGVAVRAVLAWLETWYAHDLSFRMLARTRLWIYSAIARIAPAGISRRRSGELLTTSLADAEALEVYYAHSSIYTLSAWITTPLLWAGLAVVSPPAALTVAPVLLVAVGITLIARRWSRLHGRDIRVALAELAGEVAENAGAVREIVGYDLVPERTARLDAIDDRLLAAQARNARRAGAETAVLGIVALLAATAAAAGAAWQIEAGALDAIWAPLVVILGGATTTAILQWSAMTRSYGTTREAAARIEALLSATPPVASYGERPGPDPEQGAIAAEEVSFRWRSVDPQASAHLALDAVTVRLRAGEHVALAGRSGSGKSTFAQLLARFMDPDTGAIAVAGHPLPDYERHELARAVWLLPQDVALFQETVRENLLLATDEPLGDDALWEALRVARADDIVARLPEGLDTVLSENGRSLSGGERQRLALARAVLHPAAVLILDEAVSQLDLLGERDVQNAITGARDSRTTITIAHRLSTLLSADRILVLDGGRVVGDGSHSELLECCPAYRALVLPQLEAGE